MNYSILMNGAIVLWHDPVAFSVDKMNTFSNF